jgi:flagella basal body P-ring formation protein FlgA
MLRKGGRSLIVVLVLGALIFFTVSVFLAGLANDQDVVVAKVPLSAGTRLTPALLEVKRLNASAAMPGAFTSLADVQGQLQIGRAHV